MIRRVSLALVFLAVLLIGAAYATAFDPALSQRWSAWLMVFGVAGVMAGVLMLGALGRERNLGLAVVFGALFVLLVACFGAALVLPADDPATLRLWLGLPPRAAIVVYGVGLLPLFLLPLAYAFTFRDPVPLESLLEAARRTASAQAHGDDLVDDDGRDTRPVGAIASPAATRRRLEGN